MTRCRVDLPGGRSSCGCLRSENSFSTLSHPWTLMTAWICELEAPYCLDVNRKGYSGFNLLSQDASNPLRANVRLTLTPPDGGPVLSDLQCAALAWTHEVNFFAQPCLPTRVRSPRDLQLELDSCQQLLFIPGVYILDRHFPDLIANIKRLGIIGLQTQPE